MPTKTKKLVDSNILVYAYDANSAFHQRAVTFLTNPGFDYYLTTKKHHGIFRSTIKNERAIP